MWIEKPFIQQSFIEHQHTEDYMQGNVAEELKHSSNLLYSPQGGDKRHIQ